MAIEESNCLQILNLSDNQLSEKSTTALEGFLTKMKSLTVLNLSKNNFTEPSCLGIKEGIQGEYQII